MFIYFISSFKKKETNHFLAMLYIACFISGCGNFAKEKQNHQNDLFQQDESWNQQTSEQKLTWIKEQTKALSPDFFVLAPRIFFDKDPKIRQNANLLEATMRRFHLFSSDRNLLPLFEATNPLVSQFPGIILNQMNLLDKYKTEMSRLQQSYSPKYQRYLDNPLLFAEDEGHTENILRDTKSYLLNPIPLFRAIWLIGFLKNESLLSKAIHIVKTMNPDDSYICARIVEMGLNTIRQFRNKTLADKIFPQFLNSPTAQLRSVAILGLGRFGDNEILLKLTTPAVPFEHEDYYSIVWLFLYLKLDLKSILIDNPKDLQKNKDAFCLLILAEYETFANILPIILNNAMKSEDPWIVRATLLALRTLSEKETSSAFTSYNNVFKYLLKLTQKFNELDIVLNALEILQHWKNPTSTEKIICSKILLERFQSMQLLKKHHTIPPFLSSISKANMEHAIANKIIESTEPFYLPNIENSFMSRLESKNIPLDLKIAMAEIIVKNPQTNIVNRWISLYQKNQQIQKLRIKTFPLISTLIPQQQNNNSTNFSPLHSFSWLEALKISTFVKTQEKTLLFPSVAPILIKFATPKESLALFKKNDKLPQLQADILRYFIIKSRHSPDLFETANNLIEESEQNKQTLLNETTWVEAVLEHLEEQSTLSIQHVRLLSKLLDLKIQDTLLAFSISNLAGEHSHPLLKNILIRYLHLNDMQSLQAIQALALTSDTQNIKKIATLLHSMLHSSVDPQKKIWILLSLIKLQRATSEDFDKFMTLVFPWFERQQYVWHYLFTLKSKRRFDQFWNIVFNEIPTQYQWLFQKIRNSFLQQYTFSNLHPILLHEDL